MKTKEVVKSGTALLKARLGINTPLKVSQHLTYSCNLSCKFCGRRETKTHELSTDEAKSMMKEFFRAGTVFWSFNGGEPLFRKDAGELISYAKDIGLRSFLVTNGVLVEKHFRELSELEGVELSLDGPKEYHDLICGEGVYDKVVRALSILRKSDIPVFIKSVLSKQSTQDINHVLALCEEFQAQLNIQPVGIHKEDREKRAQSYLPGKRELHELLEWIYQQKTEGRPVAASFDYLNLLKQRWPHDNNIRCWAGKLSCNVTPDGYVTACCNRLNETTQKCFGKNSGYPRAFQNLPDYRNCHQCFYSTQMELNCIVNNAPKKAPKAIKNIVNKKAVWS